MNDSSAFGPQTVCLIATTNPHKLREIRGLLDDAPARVIGLEEVLPALPEPEETGTTFRENACLKARYYDRNVHALRHSEALHHTGDLFTVAEDSGLVIDALDGEPGVRSARFIRPDASYPERFEEIFRRLAVRPERPRTARFICALAVMRDGAIVYETTGTVEGEIAPVPRGSAGFGYDPIFFYPPYRCTLAEVSEARKLEVAHRGRAFRALAEWLRAARS